MSEPMPPEMVDPGPSDPGLDLGGLSLSDKADRLIHRVDQLADAMTRSNAAFMAWSGNLRDYNRHSRLMVKGLAVAFLLELLLLWLGWMVIGSNRDRIRDIERVSVESCEQTNEVRQRNIILWEEVIRVRDTTLRPGETVEEDQARVAAFREFVARTFAPRDCTL